MRLFIAIEIPENIRNTFASLLKEFRAFAPHLKWVRAENLHVTLKFLGETDASNLDALQYALSAVQSPEPVCLEFRGLGFFPNQKRPRVLWAGMEASPNLKSLAAYIDQAAHPLGFPLEERPFTPHLTLARLPLPGIPPKLLLAMNDINEKTGHSFGSLRTTNFHLIESKLKPAGAEYTTVQSFHFAAEA
ncbi:MAG TPA: RNA 2',3'-cyclic phosphodiesterase [Candidatus Limnocylindrales bacterium]|nr:RNA 2',3'-cyclic phosphodiesterase [Candidatus Limnocylindrales bacterium]